MSIEDILGKMPEATPQRYDIFLVEKQVPYNKIPQRYPYDTNSGVGYTEEQARATLDKLLAMRLEHLTFTMRLRDMPEPEDGPDWSEE